MSSQTRSAFTTFRGSPRAVDGRYELGDLIGVGGSAEVYQALDRRLGRQVAVKLYVTGVCGPSRSRQRRELAALSGLHHPHLVELLDAGESDGRAFLVMPLVEGQTLADRLRAAPLPPHQLVAVGAAIADALGYIHDHGITHRDVKPANVLLGDRVLLSDFGIAQLLDATRITATGQLVGTAAYLAPEQVQGRQVGPPADVYALGLVMLEALTGRREYGGPPAEAAVARLVRAPVVPAGLPGGLGDLLRAMTATEPDGRPSAQVVAERLRAWSLDLPAPWPTAPWAAGTRTLTQPQPQPPSQPQSQPQERAGARLAPRRGHRALAAALLGIVLVAALAVVLARLGPSATPVLPPSSKVPVTQAPPPSPVPTPDATHGTAARPPARPADRAGVDPTGLDRAGVEPTGAGRAAVPVPRPPTSPSPGEPAATATDRGTDPATTTEHGREDSAGRERDGGAAGQATTPAPPSPGD